MCKKLYPNLINKTSKKKKEMLLLTDIINDPRSLCSCKNLCIQPITRVDSDLSSYDMIE